MAATTSVGHQDTATSILTTDFTTTNTTATDVTGMGLAVGATQTWIYQIFAKVGSSSVAGIKFAVTVPTGTTLTCTIDATSSVYNSFLAETLAAATLGSAVNTAGITSSGSGAYVAARLTVITGGNAGTVQLQIAKVTSGTATVYAGGYIFGQRIA